MNSSEVKLPHSSSLHPSDSIAGHGLFSLILMVSAVYESEFPTHSSKAYGQSFKL